jgi:hypothetical protein
VYEWIAGHVRTTMTEGKKKKKKITSCLKIIIIIIRKKKLISRTLYEIELNEYY